MPLAALFGLWAAGRLALLWSGTIGLGVAAAIDVGFYLVLAGVAGREVLAAKNRNLPIVGLVFLFGLANAADYAGAADLIADPEAGYRGGIALVVLMISLIGGRIVPSFTRNWMTKNGISDGLPGQPGIFDHFAIGITALTLLGWVLSPDAYSVGLGLALAGVLQLARLLRWRGWRTVRDPLVLILHVGYAWLPVGLLLLGWSIVGTAIPRTAAIHALTAGAMATMILAVMTRATLGHTGRDLEANAATVAIYALVTLGAAARLIATLGGFDYRMGIEVSGALWGGAMLLFALAYGPILFRPRIGN
jgi:uncharacterized protein involved in response to NO